MGMGFAPTCLREVCHPPPPLLHMTTFTTAMEGVREKAVDAYRRDISTGGGAVLAESVWGAGPW